jgi:hypothetical protein
VRLSKWGNPRRSNLRSMSAEEMSIRNCVEDVEQLGAHELLTKCVVLLGRAQDALSDWIDQQPDEYIEEKCGDGGWDEVEKMSDAEVDAELREAGIDPDELIKKTNAVLKLCKERFSDKRRIAELEKRISMEDPLKEPTP